MNEFRLSGKIINCYLSERGYFVCVIAVTHNHTVDGYNHVAESKIRCFLMDKMKSSKLDFVKGDKVDIVAYLKQDFYLNSHGTEHKRVNVYIKDISHAKSRFNMDDYLNRIAL